MLNGPHILPTQLWYVWFQLIIQIPNLSPTLYPKCGHNFLKPCLLCLTSNFIAFTNVYSLAYNYVLCENVHSRQPIFSELCGVVLCGVVWFGVVWCGIVWCSVV